MTKMAFSVEEASVMTGIGRTSIYRAIGAGRLRAKKHGVRTLILPDDLEAWLTTLPDAGRISAGEDQPKQ